MIITTNLIFFLSAVYEFSKCGSACYSEPAIKIALLLEKNLWAVLVINILVLNAMNGHCHWKGNRERSSMPIMCSLSKAGKRIGACKTCHHHHHQYHQQHHHLSLNRDGRFGHHRWFHNQFPTLLPVLHCPLGLGQIQACPFPDVVFPPLPLSALSSSPFHCALQDGFGQSWWTGDMIIPLQFASLYDGREVFVWSDCLLYLCTDFLVGNMVFIRDACTFCLNIYSQLLHVQCVDVWTLPCFVLGDWV